MRLVLAEGVRFDDVSTLMERCGLQLSRQVPQVFPARPEPHIAAWTTPDGVDATRFLYWVNPDRRAVDVLLDDDGALAGALSRALSTVDVPTLRARLAQGHETGFVAAFVFAASGAEGTAEHLVAAAAHLDEHAASGCLRALEFCEAAHVAKDVRQLASNAEQPAVIRLLAREIANALAPGPDFH